jgi:diaminopimelate epimerase
MMATVFQKMHGAGNDFVLLDLRGQALPVDAAVAARLANRRTGVGCDQVLVLRDPADTACLADFEVWNADGSKAEQCGNGVRCIGLYLHDRGETPAGRFRIGGPLAPVEIECLGNARVRVNMGEPDFDPEAVPVTAEPVSGGYRLAVGETSLNVGAVSMGNPHAMLQVSDIDHARVRTLGPAVCAHSAFPRGCNVGFAEVRDRGHIALRVFERGTGETPACGSGACAAVAILRQSGLVDDKVLVNQVGGELIIEWSGKGHPVMMTGPASHVFEGTLK